jgi:hypothetical protein
MDKYGVVLEEPDEKTKTGSKGSNCPKCGRTLTQPSYCDVCGTEPFEKKPQSK